MRAKASQNFSHIALTFCALFCAVLITACGGGGGGGGGTTGGGSTNNGGGNQVGGIDGSGSPATSITSTSGTISGFGSVIVNGIRYHIDKANILVNDKAGTETDLFAGYQVNITATLNKDGTGDATSVEFLADVVGAITQIDAANNQITVLGQTVHITNSTLFSENISPNFIDGLKLGDSVRISGQRNNDNIILATRIELAAANSPQIKGLISNLNLSDSTFTINGLTVNYASATFANVADNLLQNNLRVLVTGTINDKGILIAQTIRQLDKKLPKGSNHTELEGFISRFVSATDFDVAGLTFTTNASTEYENGSSDTLAANVQLQIVGDTNANGLLVAKKIRFYKEENRVITGKITSITTSTTGAIITASFQVAGVNIQTNTLTRVEDKSSSQLKKFNAGNLQPNDFVKIVGYSNGDTLIATQVERNTEKESAPVRLQGLVTATSINTITVNNQIITFVDETEINGSQGETLDRPTFLAQVIGKNVDVRGLIKNNVYTATRIDIKR